MSPIPAREAALRRALVYLGVHETPPGSNRGRDIDRWNLAANGVLGEPWCMSFVHGMYRETSGILLGGWAGVENFRRWADAHGYAIVRPFRGDIVCFDWNGDRWYDHVGIVERVLRVLPGPGYLVQTIEGNTDDAVKRRRRVAIGEGAVFARIPG